MTCWNGHTLVIDNFDSFTWNLVHLLEALDAQPLVLRPDQFAEDDLTEKPPLRLVISPGPGRPSSTQLSIAALRRWSGRIPILGVCLGLQCIGEAFGGRTIRAPVPTHGKTSTIQHDGRGCFSGVDDAIDVMRYHSLVTDAAQLPDTLEVSAVTEDGLPMGLRHRQHPTEGLQFHPESFLTASGRKMIENFLSW